MWMDVMLIVIAIVPLLAGQKLRRANKETCSPTVLETTRHAELDA